MQQQCTCVRNRSTCIGKRSPRTVRQIDKASSDSERVGSALLVSFRVIRGHMRRRA